MLSSSAGSFVIEWCEPSVQFMCEAKMFSHPQWKMKKKGLLLSQKLFICVLISMWGYMIEDDRVNLPWLVNYAERLRKQKSHFPILTFPNKKQKKTLQESALVNKRTNRMVSEIAEPTKDLLQLPQPHAINILKATTCLSVENIISKKFKWGLLLSILCLLILLRG